VLIIEKYPWLVCKHDWCVWLCGEVQELPMIWLGKGMECMREGKNHWRQSTNTIICIKGGT